ncbi:ABC transporter substrate-binding protein [Streptomyces longwoodensis]|uniref:ABC transporter substrate-binding protein n=1 Tax=Streptomyces longwoodensis TaxID=68231 RepID=UPI0033D42A75
MATAGLLAACSSSGGSTSASTDGALKKIVYIPGLTGNPFYNTVACGAKGAAKKASVDFSYQGAANFDVAEQTKIVNAVTATNPGAIMISITDPNAMVAPLTVAKSHGIKIIAVDGDLNDKSVMTTNIQSDGVRGGEMAGEELARAVGRRGTVLVVDNVTGSVVAEARVKGFKKAIARYPDMKVLAVQYSNNDVSKAASIVSATAGSNRDLVGVFGVQTNNTQGALTGVREAGKQGKVHVVGYDISDPITAALRDGTLDGTVVQNPRGEGATGVEAAIKAMQGKPVPRNQSADSILVTPENVDSAKSRDYIYDVNCKG